MSRKKGSKIVNGKVVSPTEEKGNPIFNISEVEPSQTIGEDIAPGALMPEDLEFERSLQAMHEPMERISDPEPIGMQLIKEREQRGEMLSDVIEDYKPATTDEELRIQVELAKVEGCDSIEATLAICKRYCKDPKLEAVGYFSYYNVKVYIAGKFQDVKKRDQVTIEQRVHRAGI